MSYDYSQQGYILTRSLECRGALLHHVPHRDAPLPGALRGSTERCSSPLVVSWVAPGTHQKRGRRSSHELQTLCRAHCAACQEETEIHTRCAQPLGRRGGRFSDILHPPKSVCLEGCLQELEDRIILDAICLLPGQCLLLLAAEEPPAQEASKATDDEDNYNRDARDRAGRETGPALVYRRVSGIDSRLLCDVAGNRSLIAIGRIAAHAILDTSDRSIVTIAFHTLIRREIILRETTPACTRLWCITHVTPSCT